MPISKHYGGHGSDVMSSMKKAYDPETAKRVFYATENKRKNEKKSKKSKRKGSGKR
jgi:hypothetical protein